MAINSLWPPVYLSKCMFLKLLGHILNQNTSQNQEQTPRRSGLWNDLEFISSLSLMHVVGEARLGLEVNIYIIIKTIQIFQELI